MHLKEPLTISVFGCVVNGPGEAHESDFGITGGKEKGMIYINGKQYRVVDEKSLVDELFKEIEERGGKPDSENQAPLEAAHPKSHEPGI